MRNEPESDDTRASGEKTAGMLNPKEVAARLGVNVQTVRRWVKSQVVVAISIGRVIRVKWPI